MKRRVLVVILVAALILAGIGVVFRDYLTSRFFQPTQSTVEIGVQKPKESKAEVEFGVFAESLDTPWSMVFLPDGDMLVTERSGTVKRIGENGQAFPISGVNETSEGGLLGLALHPQFSENNHVYLYFTTAVGGLQNRVDQYVLHDDTLTHKRTIIGGIPAANNHNGGGIAFGPDEKLYITTGDAAQGRLAQDTRSLAGKILRMNDDGSTPSDNPFGNLVWSYGHRNPQGITWDAEGRMWSVEHGPSGMDGGSGQDEINRIEKGVNYGWPTIRGDQTADGMRRPVAHSGVSETWAPSGVAFADGSLFFAGLRGQSLYQAIINDDASVSLKRHFTSEYGRLRAVAVQDDVVYFSTSNRDGRGTPAATDDRIFQAPFKLFQ